MEQDNPVQKNVDQANEVEVTENNKKFPYDFKNYDSGKLTCCWLLYPKKMYPHQVLESYF